MGTWRLVSATPTIRDRNDDGFGNYFAVEFKLQYTPAMMDTYTEMPRLEWKETITMIEKNVGTWWQFDGDQYARNPGSLTFRSWTSRYIYTYFNVCESKYGPDDANCLYSNNGSQLPKTTFKAKLMNPKDQADAVRDYLKSKGGIVTVMIIDKPGINKPNDASIHKNRILTFDCGLAGMGQRISAVQHLTVDGSVPEQQWFRECQLGGISRPFHTVGLNRVNPPDDVTIIKQFAASPIKGTYL